jgi:pSer/pThr/pTyr-binding forkhead associated (FHA) protein
MFCGWKVRPAVGTVQFLSGPMAGHSMVLDPQVTTIGSIDGNTIVLPDPAVSRKHAGIRCAGDLYELADLGSTNGVYVNGQRTAKQVLRPGDVIRVGTSEMVFRVGP